MEISKQQKNKLKRILDIINFKGDKSEYLKDLIDIASQKAFVNIVSTINEEDRKFVVEQLERSKSNDQIIKALRKKELEKQIDKILNRTLNEFTVEFIYKIADGLPQKQYDKLMKYLEEISGVKEISSSLDENSVDTYL